MILSSIPNTLRDLVAKRDQGQCRYCHLRQVGQAAIFHDPLPRVARAMQIAAGLL